MSEAHAPQHRLRKMRGRDPHESHRVATSLELLFMVVVAVAVGAGAVEAEPVDVRPPDIVDLRAIDPSIVVELAYATRDNFVGEVIDGYRANICYLRREAADALARAQARLHAARGRTYSLVVRDCYRPARAVAQFVAWTALADAPGRREAYAPLAKPELLRRGYIARRSGHSRAAAVDVSLLVDGQPADFGSAFDRFGLESHANARGLSRTARRHRALLRQVMRPDFASYRREWWHFELRGLPANAPTYDFVIE